MPQHICSIWTLGIQFAASERDVMLLVCPGDSPVYDEFVRLDTICSDFDRLLAFSSQDAFSWSSVISACRDEWYVAIGALDDAGLSSIV